MRRAIRTPTLGFLLLLALAFAGCGGGSSKSSSTGGGGAPASDTTGKQGGNITVLDAEGVDSLDPGYWYYQADYMELGQTTQRQLYGWKPPAETPAPDLAADMPKTSADGKTVTITLKPGIKYSPPLQTRSVTSADVKYSIERAFLPKVGNGYVGAYYSDIVGVKAFQDGKAKDISGITTPDDATLVLKLAKPVGIISNGQALALPAAGAVPKDYAAKYDSGKQSTYGEHAVFTGPYMIKNDGKGKVTGYQPAKRLELVRNPSWVAKTDFRPAYFDSITFLGGNDLDVASRRILSGQSLMSGDFAAPPVNVLKTALQSRKSQLSIEPSQGNRFIALNTTVKPFDNVNVRRAVAAVIDRNALRQTRGGPTLGPIATHFLPPGLPGFDEAGGLKGQGQDFSSNPNGDLNVAMSYMKKGGFPTGKYTGPALLMVGDNQPPASKTGEAFQSQLAKLGFKLNYRQVPHATAGSKFCTVPKAKVAICPNLGWGKDFFDSQSMIDPLFNSKNIVPVGNVNYAQVKDPAIDAELSKLTSETDPAKRAAGYAALDKKVTDGAYLITWLWDNQINFASANVKGVRNKFNSSWDMTYSSLK
jgi:peptide/nickel transport system substrate-binding protein